MTLSKTEKILINTHLFQNSVCPILTQQKILISEEQWWPLMALSMLWYFTSFKSYQKLKNALMDIMHLHYFPYCWFTHSHVT